MGANAPNPVHTFPLMGKYAKDDRGVLRIPPSEPHNAFAAASTLTAASQSTYFLVFTMFLPGACPGKNKFMKGYGYFYA